VSRSFEVETGKTSIGPGNAPNLKETNAFNKTDPESKEVMLRAERADCILIKETKSLLADRDVPEKATVVQRNDTYFGPKLMLDTEIPSQAFHLTAPGPTSNLLLWDATVSEAGYRGDWMKLAKVSVEFASDQTRYRICPHCGDPLKTIEHERQAANRSCM
jgi:NADH pyrophosphatase NudC (nudix superfamily)